jgi:hypothetical protein
MYEDIRQLIVENSIREALEATDALGPEGEFRTSLLLIQRRWRLLETQALNQSQHEHVMRVEENQVIEDLIALLDRMEEASESGEHPTEEKSPPPEVESAPPPVRPSAPPRKKANPAVWILGTILAAFFLYSVNYMAQKFPGNNGSSPNRAEVVERDPRQPSATEEKPTENAPTTSDGRANPGLKLDPSVAEKLQEAARVDVDRTPTINPDLLNARRVIFRGSDFMSAGKQVNAGLAFYYNKGSGSTEFVDRISKEMANLLGRKFGVEIDAEVLLKGFHTNSLRNTIMTRGDRTDKRFSTQRAKYLILVDLRNVKLNQAELRICLVNLATGEAHNVREKVEVQSGGNFPGNEVYLTTIKVLNDFANRKLWEIN